MPKIIRKKYLNIDSNLIENKKNHTIFVFVNIKNLKINNIKRKLMHNTNFFLKKEKLYSINKKISKEKIGNYITRKFNINEPEFYIINDCSVKIYLILISNKEKNNLKIKGYSWRKYIDLYNINNENDRDINKYFSILNESFNSHIYNKLFTEEDLGNTYIKLICIYKKLCIHFDK